MPNPQITVNSRKYDQSISRSWKCELLERKASMLVLLGHFDSEIHHPDLGEIRRGTISYEYYWLDRWYNVFSFHQPDGRFRNYYCNINMPPSLENGVLDYVDLDIDVLVWPDNSYKILDWAEYNDNSTKFAYPEIIRASVDSSLRDLIDLIDNRKLPGPKQL